MIEPLLRGLLGRAHEQVLSADRRPELAQERVHCLLSRGLIGTRAGMLQQLSVYEDLEKYRRNVRLTTYADYAPLVQRAMGAPHAGAYFERGDTLAFGHSSSGSKYIPYTKAHLASFRGFQLDVAAEIGFSVGDAAIFTGRSFMIQGNLDVTRSDVGVVSGYSSAVMVEQTPWLLRRRLRPQVADLRERDLQARVSKIGQSLLEERPRILAGIPAYVAGVLRLLLQGPQADALREVLRGVTLYGWSGSTLGPYRSLFESLFAPGCVFMDAVSATEGAIGIRCHATGAYRFAFNRTLLLFAPVGSPADRFYAWELDRGQDYEIILGSFAGLLGYRLGDRIRLTQDSPLRFELLPRAHESRISENEASLLFGKDTDYYAYLNPETQVLEVSAESLPDDAALGALAACLGGRSVHMRVVPRGRIAHAGLMASAVGLTKLARLNQDPRVHELMSRYL